jgi:hypothetical protein
MMKNLKQGEKITGESLLDEKRAEVTGEFIRPFGTKGTTALLIQTGGGTRHVIDGNTARPAEPTTATVFRQLAEHLDGFVELDHIGSVSTLSGKLRVQIYEPPGSSAIAAIVPWLRSIGSLTVSARRVEKNWHLNGSGKVTGGLPIEVIVISEGLEADALDVAFGKSKLNDAIPLEVLARHQRPLSEITHEQLAEVEHWSKTPLPGGVK